MKNKNENAQKNYGLRTWCKKDLSVIESYTTTIKVQNFMFFNSLK